ncbi:hypothetical protein SEVIR_7G069186v4 [Setaria viridis]
MLWRRRLTALASEFPDIELMLLAVGSAWSLQPRDGLHATTGYVSYFYLLVKQCYSKSLILNMSQNFKHYIFSLAIFSLYTISITMGIPEGQKLKTEAIYGNLIVP